jgi:peptidyl-prolyl cis-trans isomerase D
MFDLFRSRDKSVRILLGVLLGLVALSMLVYLIPGGPGSTEATGQSVVAVVGDDKITAQELQRTVQQIASRQQNMPKALLAFYIPSIVNQMVDAKAMAYKARELGLKVSDQELANAIQSEFTAQLGQQFDMNVYQQILAQQGMTVADFEKGRREAMLAMRLDDLEAQSLFVSDVAARAEYARTNEKVGLQYIAFNDKDFASKVNKDAAAVKAYFEKNRAEFRIPEKRDFNLIVGSVADFMPSVHITDAELQKQYQDNLDSYRVPERVDVRHILIKTQGKPKDQWPRLKTKADTILKQLQQGGDFAQLAKKNSEDPGSAEKGGELGWITKGQTVPNFEKAAFSLKPGELSGVVETEYGYHIIEAEKKEAGHVKPFDEVKPQLLTEAQKDAATANLKKAVDDARAAVAKNPAQAQEIAQKYHLQSFKLNNIASGEPLPQVGTQPEVTSAIFTTSKGSVSNVVNLDNQGKAAFGVVTNVVPAHPAQYADVQKEVLQKYTAAESTRLAQGAAKNAAAQARKGESLQSLAKQYGATVKTAAPFTINGAAEGIGSATLLAEAFKGKVGDIIGPVAAQSDQFVCKVSEKIPADMNQFAKDKTSIIQSLAGQKRATQQPLFRESIVSELKRRGKVKLNQDTINRIVSAFQA